jgi:hypothetical protein
MAQRKIWWVREREREKRREKGEKKGTHAEREGGTVMTRLKNNVGGDNGGNGDDVMKGKYSERGGNILCQETYG